MDTAFIELQCTCTTVNDYRNQCFNSESEIVR